MTIRIAATAAAAVAMLTAGSLAAAPPLAEKDVRGFFQNAEQTLSTAMQDGKIDRAMAWARTHFADDAHLYVSEEIFAGRERKSLIVATLNKQDLMTLGRMASGLLAGPQGRGMRDYELDIEVGSVKPIGPNAATAHVSYTESGTFRAQDDMPAASLKAVTDCRHLVRRGDDGSELRIGMTACESRVEF